MEKQVFNSIPTQNLKEVLPSLNLAKCINTTKQKAGVKKKNQRVSPPVVVVDETQIKE